MAKATGTSISRTSRLRSATLLISALALAGCAAYDWGQAVGHEQNARYLPAVEAYERFARRRPADPRACVALLKAAEIYAFRLERCLEARRLYEAAARDYETDTACSARAKAGLLSCPDFFPLRAGLTWVYGDSASGGRNMRLEWRVAASSGTSGEVASALYAGRKQIRSELSRFEKAEWGVWELVGKERALMLKYPYSAGSSWTARSGGRQLRYSVESDSLEVKTAGGTFSGCLKVREHDRSFADSWKFDYYCPGVGRVKTTIAGRGFENPNTELLKFGKIH